MSGFFVILILYGVGISPALKGLKHGIATGGSLGGYILGIIACSVLISLIVYVQLDNFFGSEAITVSPTDLTIQWLVCGTVRSQRELPNSTIEQLRCERWPGPRGTGMQNGIRFECVGETITFAQNLPEEESYELIDQMRQVYQFSIPDPPEEEASPAVVKL